MKKILLIFFIVTLIFGSAFILTGCCMSHAWIEETTAPTCTEQGIRGSKCTKCGYYTEYAYWRGTFADKFNVIYIDPLGHDYVPTDRVDDAGNEYVEFKCSRCDDAYNMMYTPAREATCKKDGNIEYYKRSTDGKYFTDKFASNEILLPDTVIPKDLNKHSGEWTVISNPTCTATGEKTRTCTICGTFESKIINANGHDWDEWLPDIEPTCTQSVSQHRTCSVCNESDTRTLAALGHDYGVTWQWTGLDAAKAVMVCTRDASHRHEGAAVITMKDTATCTADGHEVYTASVTIDGREYTDVKYVDSPAKGHNIVDLPAVEATCDTEGKSAGKACNRCGSIIVAQDTIPITHPDTDRNGYCDKCSTFIETIIQINTESDLKSIVNDLSATYALKSDITLSDDWHPLGTKDDPFTGKLYGDGHFISGIKFGAEKEGGLFVSNRGVIDGVTLKNFSISAFKAENTAEYFCGGFAAYNYGTITDCAIDGNNTFRFYFVTTLYSGSATQKINMGGFCGVNYGTINNCNVNGYIGSSFYMEMQASWSGAFPGMNESRTMNVIVYLGNVAGKNNGTIKNTNVNAGSECSLSGKATTRGTAVSSYVKFTVFSGSFVGSNEKSIIDCSAKSGSIVMDKDEQNSACHVTFDIKDVSRYSGLLGEDKGTIERLNIKFD